MLIEENALKHWMDNFYGYGSWHARFWFVSHEEGGGELPEEVAERLNYFQKIPAQPDGTLCDIRDLYRHVTVRWNGPKANAFDNFYEYRFGNKAAPHVIWQNLVAFMHAYRGQVMADLLDYQKQTFASPSAHNEALIRLYPLPAPHSHSWYYNWLDLPKFPFLKSRLSYEEHVYEHRMQKILSNILTFKPELVLMYGMNNINTLKKSVEEFFGDVKFKMIKSEKQLTPQYHRADINGTAVLITTQIPALRHNRVETGFDWAELGKRVAKGDTQE